MNRRDFLKRIEAISAAGTVIGATAASGGCLGFHYASSSLISGRLVIRRSDFGKSRFVMVDHPGFPLPLYVHELDDGSFVAVSTRCMHRGCQVEPADGKLICPCHGSEYDTQGAVLKGPTRRPLERYPVTADDQVVAIDLSRPAVDP